MHSRGIKFSLYLNYFVFAILLNSVGILIQKSINTYHVDELKASSLEAFKDLSIAFVSFFVGSFLPRLGYKKGMLIALALVFAGCLGMYFGNSFTSVRILFACVGISFAVIKVSVYSMIGLVTNNDNEHKSLLSSIESFFMIGIAAAFIIFPLFYSDIDPNAWLRIYLVLAALVAASFLILVFSDFNIKYEIPGTNISDDFVEMIKLLKRPLVIVFAISAFMYVMTEQGIMSWLPTFNQKVLYLPESTSVYMAVILMLSIALGRYICSVLVKKILWVYILVTCLVLAALMVVFILPKTEKILPQSSLYKFPLSVEYKGEQKQVDNLEDLQAFLKGKIDYTLENKEYEHSNRSEIVLANGNLFASKYGANDSVETIYSISIINKKELETLEKKLIATDSKLKLKSSNTIIERQPTDLKIKTLSDIPWIAFIFPLIGLFLAPIYPLINSFVLSATEKIFHSPMASLLVFFSAIGGTLGSRLVGYLFKNTGGAKAFYFSLIPMAVLLLCLFFFYRHQKKTGITIQNAGSAGH
jgi:MFS transporter, FHS family, glucose/mannose:H+ symporter